MDGITAGTITAIIGVLIWYLKYQTKRNATREDKQDKERSKREEKLDEERKEERLFNRNIITNELKEIHQDNHKNTELNVQGITLQKDMLKGLNESNKHNEDFQNKTVETLGLICDKMNGNNPNDRRKKYKKVEVERRKNVR